MNVLSQKKVAVFGSLTEDLFVFPHQTEVFSVASPTMQASYLALPHGGKLTAEYIETHYGGGAANVAVSLSSWGVSSMVFGAVGDDPIAQRIIENLQKKKVQINALQHMQKTQSGFSLILSAFDGERTVIFTPEANVKCQSYDTEQLSSFMPDAIHVCNITAPVDTPLRLDLLQYLSDNPLVLFSWNPGKTDLSQGMEKQSRFLNRCDILFLNAEEAEFFSGEKRIILSDIEKKNEMDNFLPVSLMLLSYGVKTICITDGKKGAMIYTKQHFFYVPPVDLPRVSTLGAGDAFVSGFLAGILMGKDLQSAGKCASMNAASVVGVRGAQQGIISLEAVQKY